MSDEVEHKPTPYHGAAKEVKLVPGWMYVVKHPRMWVFTFRYFVAWTFLPNAYKCILRDAIDALIRHQGAQFLAKQQEESFKAALSDQAQKLEDSLSELVPERPARELKLVKRPKSDFVEEDDTEVN